jgi:hypothetical protein
MARRQAKQHNKLRIHDNLSDSDITLFFRMPTTKERQEYQNMALRRKGNAVEMNQAEARLTYGMKILEGVGDGDFERLDGDNYVPISSREGSPDYYPGWKPFVEENGGDLVMLMAAHVYDASATLQLGGESIEGK